MLYYAPFSYHKGSEAKNDTRKRGQKMAKVAQTVLEKIGKTPLVEISNKLNKGGARVLAKVEFFNPGGSAKDRIALAMVETPRSAGS